MKDPFKESFHEGAPVKEKVVKVMIPLHKVWGFFKKRKKKRVRRKT